MKDYKVGSRVSKSNNAKLVRVLVPEDEEEHRMTSELFKMEVRG